MLFVENEPSLKDIKAIDSLTYNSNLEGFKLI